MTRPAARLGKLAAALVAAALAAGCGTAPQGWAEGIRATPTTARAVPVAGSRACTVTARLVPSCGAWWGMYLPVAPSGAGLVGAVRGQERALARGLDLIEVYHDFSASPNGLFPNAAESRLARHHLLLFSWAPSVWSSHTYFRWSAVAAGAFDRSVIIPEARRLAAFGHTVFLSFSAEPDGAVPGNGTPAEFVAAWRHIHGLFARLGVRDVVWVWTTTGYVPHAATISALYPGNAYVDWIGYDPYNFYVCHRSAWHTFAGTVRPFYDWVVAHHLGAEKPIMLAEFGSAPKPADPGQEAAWYRSIVPVLAGLPRLKALILWNSRTPGCDLELRATPAAAAAYRATGLSAYLRPAARP